MLNIRPISDLRNDFTEIEKEVSDKDKPIIFTKNGRGTMVLVSLERYSKMAGVEYIERALDEADEFARTNAEDLTHEEVFSKIRTKLGA